MQPNRNARPKYSLVIPVFNEEQSLPLLFSALDGLLAQLDAPAEVLLINDGSRDNSGTLIQEKVRANPSYKYIEFSRNFGHQAAISAGMDYASGAAVIMMDADLQDTPSLILEMIAKWKEGYDIVYAQRVARHDESRFKRLTARWFYRLIGFLASVEIPGDVGDFRLVDISVVKSFRSMRERDRFIRGMFAWMGYRQVGIPFDRPGRTAGQTKYSLRKMVRLGLDGILGFSDTPLKLIVLMGLAVSFAAIAYGLYVIAQRATDDSLVTGWASTIVVIAFLSGINMILTGIVGLYVGRIHHEVKGRPLYLVYETMGFDADPQHALSRAQRPAAAPLETR